MAMLAFKLMIKDSPLVRFIVYYYDDDNKIMNVNDHDNYYYDNIKNSDTHNIDYQEICVNDLNADDGSNDGYNVSIDPCDVCLCDNDYNNGSYLTIIIGEGEMFYLAQAFVHLSDQEDPEDNNNAFCDVSIKPNDNQDIVYNDNVFHKD